MKRAARETRRERRGREGPEVTPPGRIDCVACGLELGPSLFSSDPPGAVVVICLHDSRYGACARCEVEARHLVAVHDRTGRPVRRPKAAQSAE